MSETDSDRNGCTGEIERAEHDAAYRRALRMVAILNIREERTA